MLDILSAIAPVFIVIMLGTLFKRTGMPGNDFWPYAERITYYVLLPCLFFSNVAHAEFHDLDIAKMLWVLASCVVGMTVLCLILYPLLKIDGPSFTSLFQGSIRFNNYVGIPTAIALFNDKGLILSAIMIAVLVPMINSTCVAVLNHYGSHENVRLAASIRRIITNPLIIACIAGGVVNALDIPIPHSIDEVLDVLSNASLAFGLLTVGAGLDIRATQGMRHIIFVTSFIKLVIFPMMAIAICLWFALDNITAQIVILYMALPTASSSYIMAKQMGGNAPLMAGITVMETILAGLSIPIVLIISRMLFS